MTWPATQDVLKSLAPLSGKTVIDATNPLLPDLAGLEIGMTTSAGEKVAEWASDAKVVKAFNTIGYNIMANRSPGLMPALRRMLFGAVISVLGLRVTVFPVLGGVAIQTERPIDSVLRLV
jgi:hypothetical protein